MTDIWKKKAEEWLWDSCGYAPDDSVDELSEWMEKAEKWDNIMEKSMEAPYIDCIGNTKKLEAVKEWFKKNEDCIDHDYADEDATARVKLRRILGVEG